MSDTELLPKSNSEPVRRLEVFTGSGRRRAWTAEQKARIIAETYESGATVSAVARRHGLTPQQLFGWRRHVRQGAQERSGDSSTAFCAGDCGSTPARRGHTNRAETGDRNRGRRHDGSGCARDRGVRMRPRNSSRKHRTHPTSVDGAAAGDRRVVRENPATNFLCENPFVSSTDRLVKSNSKAPASLGAFSFIQQLPLLAVAVIWKEQQPTFIYGNL